MDLLKLLYIIMLNQDGVVEGADGDDGTSDDSGQPADKGDAPTGEDGGKEGQPEPEAEPAEPKYGDFGNDPSVDDVFDAHRNLQSEHETLKGKTTTTEKNLSALRRAADSKGLKVLTDTDGNVDLVPKDTPGKSETKRRFTDEHRALFDKNVLSAIEYMLDDRLDNRFGEYDKMQGQRSQFFKMQDTANNRMMTLYPSLDPDESNQSFNQAFYDRATDIWKQSYKNFPNGELIAAGEAAIEMGIAPSQLVKAERRGYEKGSSPRKVLGPVSGSRVGSGTKRLSREEYLALSTDEKEKYDEKQLTKK